MDILKVYEINAMKTILIVLALFVAIIIILDLYENYKNKRKVKSSYGKEFKIVADRFDMTESQALELVIREGLVKVFELLENYDETDNNMQIKYICRRRWYKGKKRRAFEKLITLIKPFYQRNSYILMSEQRKAKEALCQMYKIFCETPCDKRKIIHSDDRRYLHRLTKAASNLVKKDYWNCCHELNDIFDLEPVFQPQIAYSIKKMLEMAIDVNVQEQ